MPLHQAKAIKSTDESGLHTAEAIKGDVNSILERHFEVQQNRAFHQHHRYGELLQELRDFVLRGGKRLRPILTVYAYEAYGGTDYTSICQVGAAIELLHSALLIHDDIIDRDETRYGHDNITGTYRKKYKSQKLADLDTGHFANSAALLAGDINISASYQLILDSNLTPSQKLHAQKLLGDAIFKVAGGELIDTDALFYADEDTDPLEVAATKTAHYSFITPLIMGASMADANEDELAKLTEVGTNLGIGYQLKDDLIGIFGSQESSGKSNTSDIREGKQTYVFFEALNRANSEHRKILDTYYGNTNVTSDQCDLVRKVITDTGALIVAEQQIQLYSTEACKIIESLAINSAYRKIFLQLCQTLTVRQA